MVRRDAEMIDVRRQRGNKDRLRGKWTNPADEEGWMKDGAKVRSTGETNDATGVGSKDGKEGKGKEAHGHWAQHLSQSGMNITVAELEWE